MPAFTIVADGPKMEKADPTRRTRCSEATPPGSPAAAKPPPFPRLLTCQNISMEQFGKMLPTISGGYTRVPALDKTGLTGGYDFTLNFSPFEQVQGHDLKREQPTRAWLSIRPGRGHSWTPPGVSTVSGSKRRSCPRRCW